MVEEYLGVPDSMGLVVLLVWLYCTVMLSSSLMGSLSLAVTKDSFGFTFCRHQNMVIVIKTVFVPSSYSSWPKQLNP